MSIDEIISRFDATPLSNKQQYQFYHKLLVFTLKEFNLALKQYNLCTPQEAHFFNQFTDLLLYSIDALRIKYKYDSEYHMKLDLTHSGFPNYLEFRYLYNDLGLKDEFTNKLDGMDTMKAEFLDTLLKYKKPIKTKKLYQAASLIYYTTVNRDLIFNRFVQGKCVDSESAWASKVVSWSFYDVSFNRPFVCYLYFEYEGDNLESYKEEIYKVLKNNADRKMPLEIMAYGIDKKLPDILPKFIKRIDLGPLHNIFTKDDHQVTHALLEGIGKKEINPESYAISLKIDSVKSTSSFKEGNFFNKQILQNWTVQPAESYLLAPHRIIQLLYNKASEATHKLTKAPLEMPNFKTN